MKICDAMYFVLGSQLCMYAGYGCPYEGDKVIMQFGKEEGVVTYCTLNNLERLLDKKFLDD